MYALCWGMWDKGQEFLSAPCRLLQLIFCLIMYMSLWFSKPWRCLPLGLLLRIFQSILREKNTHRLLDFKWHQTPFNLLKIPAYPNQAEQGLKAESPTSQVRVLTTGLLASQGEGLHVVFHEKFQKVSFLSWCRAKTNSKTFIFLFFFLQTEFLP